MEKFCKSCGMPMDKQEDFANRDMSSNYCYYCGDILDIIEEPLEEPTFLKKEEYYKKKQAKIKKKQIKKKAKKK